MIKEKCFPIQIKICKGNGVVKIAYCDYKKLNDALDFISFINRLKHNRQNTASQIIVVHLVFTPKLCLVHTPEHKHIHTCA